MASAGGGGGVSSQTKENTYFKPLMVNLYHIFKNIIIIGMIDENNILHIHTNSDLIKKANEKKVPLILLLEKSGSDGHAVVYLPHRNIIYDNHYADRHYYTIKSVAVNEDGYWERKDSRTQALWTIIKQYTTPFIKLEETPVDKLLKKWLSPVYSWATKTVFNPETIQTGMQSIAPGEGVCLYSALIIYIALMEKKKNRLAMEFIGSELDDLRKTCDLKKIKYGFFYYILEPTIKGAMAEEMQKAQMLETRGRSSVPLAPDTETVQCCKKRKVTNTKPTNAKPPILGRGKRGVSVPPDLPYGGKRRRRKTRRKSRKNKKRIKKTKRNVKRGTRQRDTHKRL